MRIGIVGAGQLAQMTAQAAKALDIETVCLALSPDECAGRESELCIVPMLSAEYANGFISDVDIITIETENIPLEFAEYLAAQKPLRPPVKALAIAQDRLLEKQLFEEIGLSPAPFYAIDSEDDIPAAIKKIGLPGILKTRRLGYDGKGQVRCYTEDDLIAGVKALSPAALIYEGLVSFEREVSLIGVRSTTGEAAFYPLCENTHKEGILRTTKAPYLNDALTIAAQKHMKALFDVLDYVGVLTIEFFVTSNGLVGNEMAPRVHNSGHWTIEGAETSQFENHLRAITGMPLGSCEARGYSVMHNYIGELPEPSAMKNDPNVFYHLYGKEVKPLRKVGHVTVVSDI
ncbi:MAG: 5-(carboxyamino)imidazole ribonucleotide synthase [Gammaproteobacteria bacterium]